MFIDKYEYDMVMYTFTIYHGLYSYSMMLWYIPAYIMIGDDLDAMWAGDVVETSLDVGMCGMTSCV